MKPIKRLLLRPFYAIYWIVYKLKYPRIIADGKARPELRDFNGWLYAEKWFSLPQPLENLKVIIPKSYHDLIERYPKLNYINIEYTPKVGGIERAANKVFYHYEAPKEDKI